jgi:hypothetical protein
MGKMVRAGAGAGIFDKLEPEPEPHKNGPAPQLCLRGRQYSVLVPVLFSFQEAKDKKNKKTSLKWRLKSVFVFTIENLPDVRRGTAIAHLCNNI